MIFLDKLSKSIYGEEKMPDKIKAEVNSELKNLHKKEGNKFTLKDLINSSITLIPQASC